MKRFKDHTSPQLFDAPVIMILALSLSAFAAIALRQTGFSISGAKLMFVSIALQDGLIIAGIAFFLYKLRGCRWQSIGLHPLRKIDVLYGLAGGFLLYLIMMIVVALMQVAIPGGLPPQNVEHYMDVNAPWIDTLLVVFAVVVIAPITEEALFRGYFYHSLVPLAPPQGAMFITAIAFALVHGDMIRLPAFILGGYLLNIISVRSGNVLTAMMAHATWNAAMMAAYYIG